MLQQTVLKGLHLSFPEDDTLLVMPMLLVDGARRLA
jgi:hypothetical protein